MHATLKQLAAPVGSALLATALVGCSGASTAGAEPATPAAVETPILEMPELMIHVIDPAARNFWKGWGEVLTQDGWTDISPKTEAEWKVVEDGAASLMIAASLLRHSPNTREPAGKWGQFAGDLLNVARAGKASAEQQDKQAMFELGEKLDQACDSCHADYAPHAL